MKVTKRGKPSADRKWVGTCMACDSEATAVQSEMTHITEDPREGGSHSWETCPVCGAGENDAGYGGMCFYPKVK